MAFLIGILASFLYLLWWFNRQNTKWLNHGRFLRRADVVINQHDYYMEEVKFDSYRQALGAFSNIIDDVYSYGKAVDIKYDLYDWTFAYIQFEDVTIAIKHYRPLNRIQLVQSKEPITICAIESDFLFIPD